MSRLSVKVENMSSPRSGREVANQFVITLYDEQGTLHEFFQSYRSIIACKTYGQNPHIELDEHYWNYSTTTSKYRNEFLGEDTKTTKKKIESKEYVLVNLN